MSFIVLYGNACRGGEFIAEEIVAFVVVFCMDAQQTGEGIGEQAVEMGRNCAFLMRSQISGCSLRSCGEA